MRFDPIIAAIRFGTGLSPRIGAPESVDQMMAVLRGPDEIAAQVPIARYGDVSPSTHDFWLASRAVNAAADGSPERQAAQDQRDALRAKARATASKHLAANVARSVATRDGLRERLTEFWADHFTVRAVSGNTRHMVSSYIEEAIRPHVAGLFGDMLVAVVANPMMIVYLDQHQSMGPNSQTAQQRDRGLNENLAREVLELHTLGVGGAYSQTDVREFAELLTGVTASAQRGSFFRAQQAEPGAETVLGVSYGGDEESIEFVNAALRDLAVHPDTAQHLARKLAVHFVSPTPDETMVAAMAARYLETGGDLGATVEVMLRSDGAWGVKLEKVKQPFDFVTSALRALDVPLAVITNATRQDIGRVLSRPLTVMGQSWQSALGPDGWPEDEENWITPQGMAGRISWAMQMPRQVLDDLPDPREFVFHALGPTPPEPVVFAADAAETVSDGVGIVLASSAFQRR